VADEASILGGEPSVFKLVIEESGTIAESGVILRAAGAKMIVVAGVPPFTLAVGGIWSLPRIFDPEYPIDQYTHVPFA
jgi:hypothetical protein